jgi:hypothetical protein
MNTLLAGAPGVGLALGVRPPLANTEGHDERDG